MDEKRKIFIALFALFVLLLILWVFYTFFSVKNEDSSYGVGFNIPYISRVFDENPKEQEARLGSESNVFGEKSLPLKERYAFNENLELIAESIDRSRGAGENLQNSEIDPDVLSAESFPQYHRSGMESVRRAMLLAGALKKRPPLPSGLGPDDPLVLEKLFLNLSSSGRVDSETSIPLETEGDVFRFNEKIVEFINDLGGYAREGEYERAKYAARYLFPKSWRGEHPVSPPPSSWNFEPPTIEFIIASFDKLALSFMPEARAYTALLDDFVTIPDCWKAKDRFAGSHRGGENLYAPCCNCGIKYIPPYDIEFVYDCGTYEDLDVPINEECNLVPLGCLNLICYGEDANAIFNGPPGYKVPAKAGWGGGFNTDWGFECGCDSEIVTGSGGP